MNQESFTLSRWFRTPLGLCLIISAAASTMYLVFAHTVHVVGALPYLMLLLCPALHLLMHGGHGNHQHEEQASPTKQPPKENPGCH